MPTEPQSFKDAAKDAVLPITVVSALLVIVALVIMSGTVDRPGKERAEHDQQEATALLAVGRDKTPYLDIKTPTAVKVVAKLGAPYEVLSPGSQLNCTIFPTGTFSRVGPAFVGKRFLVSLDKQADTDALDQCEAGSLFLWGPVDQPSLGNAVSVTPGDK
jgi:hypothetical protein